MRVARTTGAGAGILIVVLGIWGALIPFVGPYFNYGFGPDSAWHYTADRLWLNILPGAVAVIGGLAMIVAARRGSGIVGGWIALAAGVWFLIGPSLSLLWHGTAPGFLSSGIGAPIGGPDRAAIDAIGFFYGIGAVITAFSAFAIGRFASRPSLAEREILAAESGGVGAAGGAAIGRGTTAGEPIGSREAAAAPAAPAERPVLRFGRGRMRSRRGGGILHRREPRARRAPLERTGEGENYEQPPADRAAGPSR